MNDGKYLPRIVDEIVHKHLSSFGAVCIEGAKWCGKTWTANNHSKSKIYLGDPAGNFQNKSLAQIDPKLVLEGDSPRLIDEWQEVPEIWDAVRFEVDQRGRKGQFILTGSATPAQKGILHSGAGRISTLRMRPMSLYESNDSSGQVSLEDICNEQYKNIVINQPSLDKIIELVIRGGWPGSLDLKESEYTLTAKEYLNAIINHDIYRLEGINRNTRKMNLLLKSLARNESTAASMNTLKKDIKEMDEEDIDNDTISVYLTLFERMFLTENQKSFSSNIRSSTRIKKLDKRHFVDPSLACALLNASSDMLIKDLNTLGFLFEALCERDLRIYAESFNAILFHYQDYDGDEIDAVIELNNGDWVAIEIKLGSNQIDEAANSLKKIRNKILKDGGKPPKVLCIVCGISKAAYLRDDGVYVVPITALKN
ncbi:MAG: ATP-binding protein [Tissierellales bacterium]|nr:ATP-binding protein [Tissierellales bacterium]MBN2827386.1 ATP-binding protein [Tissierellales bacterium]